MGEQGRLSRLPHLPPLPPEEVKHLVILAQQGDEAAKEKLVQANLRLVSSLVQRFRGRGYEEDDLLQVGVIGLLKAICHFDTSYETRFSTYAVPLIIGEIRRYIRDDQSVHVNRSLKESGYQVYQTSNALREKFGREPTISEIAKALSTSEGEVALALEAAQTPASLDQPLTTEEDLRLGDTVTGCQGENDWIDTLAMKEALAHLSEREQKLILLRFFLGRTQNEVAEEFAISQAQVSRLEKNALLKIRQRL